MHCEVHRQIHVVLLQEVTELAIGQPVVQIYDCITSGAAVSASAAIPAAPVLYAMRAVWHVP